MLRLAMPLCLCFAATTASAVSLDAGESDGFVLPPAEEKNAFADTRPPVAAEAFALDPLQSLGEEGEMFRLLSGADDGVRRGRIGHTLDVETRVKAQEVWAPAKKQSILKFKPTASP